MNFIRTMAGAFAVSITTTAWEDTTATRHSDLSGTLNNAGGFINGLVGHGFSFEQARNQLDAVVQSQAVMLATNHVFQVAAFVFLLAGAVVWIMPKAGPPPTDAAAAAH